MVPMLRWPGTRQHHERTSMPRHMQSSCVGADGQAAVGTDWTRRRLGMLALFLVCGCLGRPSAAAPPTLCDHSPVGECSAHFPIPKPAAGESGVVQPLKGRDAGGNAYVWFWDPTPGRNPTRQLVRITPKRVGCTILFLPNAETHDFRLVSRGRLPGKVTAASATINDSTGDGHYFEYEYGLDKRSGLYRKVPVCFRVNVPGRDRQPVSCLEATQ